MTQLKKIINRILKTLRETWAYSQRRLRLFVALFSRSIKSLKTEFAKNNSFSILTSAQPMRQLGSLVRNNLRLFVGISTATVLTVIISLNVFSNFLSIDVGPNPWSQPKPQFIPGGSASRNLPFFQMVLEESGAGGPTNDLTQTITNLVDAGFNVEDITYTPAKTKINISSDSVSVAIEINGECLIGQYSSSWLTTTVTEPTVSGCLIGQVIQPSTEPK
jgi:hypothetical protein